LIEALYRAIFGFNVRDPLFHFLSAHSREIITLSLGDDRSAITPWKENIMASLRKT